jgi:hypothetical protein
MPVEVFTIKSLLVQNTLMLSALGIIILFLIRAVWMKRRRHIVVFSIWLCLVIGFFNSSLFGFSEVRVSPKGLRINYGFLSVRNTQLPLDSDWRIQKHRAGLRKTKRLYSLVIAGRESMRVSGGGGLRNLEEIGLYIDRMKADHLRK